MSKNGLQFSAEVKKLYTDVTQILLTGYDKENALRESTRLVFISILRSSGITKVLSWSSATVDRILDMMRSCVNVWSDSCGTVIIARSEGETGLKVLRKPATA